MGRKNPTEFYKLWARLLPTQLTGDPANPLVVVNPDDGAREVLQHKLEALLQGSGAISMAETSSLAALFAPTAWCRYSLGTHTPAPDERPDGRCLCDRRCGEGFFSPAHTGLNP